MNSALRIPLNASAEQFARLKALQAGFARVCNALAPLVQQTRVWNRVALHHLSYRSLRAQFPEMGSQMVCNAIYSVSRTSRLLYQHPQSPFNVAKLGAKPLPLLKFTDTSPVYFDRHTLSIKDRQLSMFTLDGRMRFALALSAQDEEKFQTEKLREIVLALNGAGQYALSFIFGEAQDAESGSDQAANAKPVASEMELPQYVVVEEGNT